MAFQVLGRCFKTDVEAAQHLCGSLAANGEPNSIQSCTGANAGSGVASLTFVQFELLTGTASEARTLAIPLQPCDMAAIQPFDYALATAFWTVAFTLTVGSWAIAKNAGVVISFFRR